MGILVEIDIIYVVYLIRTETKKMSRQNIWSEQNKFYTLTFGIPCLFFIQFCSWIDFAVMHLKIQYNLCLLFKHIIQLIGSKFMISDKFLVLIMWFKAFTQTKKNKIYGVTFNTCYDVLTKGSMFHETTWVCTRMRLIRRQWRQK